MRQFARLVLVAALVCPLAAALSSGCSGDEAAGGTAASSSQSTGTAGTGSATGAGGAGGAGGEGTASGGASSGSGGTGDPPTVIVPCGAQVYECGDLVDNDSDGLLDSQDPDCLGPCDNTENSYYGGIPGQMGPACIVDCYFDSNSGAGNDNCYWNHACDPHEVAPGYYPEPENKTDCAYDVKANTPGTGKSCAELNQTQSDTCHKVCGPLTPNGCDCFGCCELPASSGKFVWLGSIDAVTKAPSCKMADLADPDKCHPCKPVDACLNGCDVCELCLGKTTLPPECFPDGGSGSGSGGAGGGGTTAQCPAGIQPCGLPGQASCPSKSYCITGCCQDIPG